MTKRKVIVISVCLAAVLGAAFARHAFYSSMESTYRRLDLTTLERITDGSVSHEMRWGRIFVTIVDRFDDAHLQLLHHAGVSKRRALQIVAEKETELKRRATGRGSRPDRENAASQP